ncbi:hypothetical protein VX159_06085 [Dechloromonas sp. ZY10]|uniref:hypothetical protein n=1 Tax=Dechloromonas aquae TaxID=2664436 RepID=UPI003529D17D
MNLLRHFDRIYILNLSSGTKPRERAASELAAHGLEIDDRQVRWVTPPSPGSADGFPDIDARHRFEAHLTIIDEAIAANLASVLICEAQLHLDPRTDAPGLNLLWPLCTEEWDFTYLGHDEPLPDSGQPPRWGSTRQELASTVCYALSRRIMPALREYLVHSRAGGSTACCLPLDAAYSAFRQAHPECLTLIAMPPLVTPTPSHGIWPRWLSRPLIERSWFKAAWRH